MKQELEKAGFSEAENKLLMALALFFNKGGTEAQAIKLVRTAARTGGHILPVTQERRAPGKDSPKGEKGGGQLRHDTQNVFASPTPGQIAAKKAVQKIETRSILDKRTYLAANGERIPFGGLRARYVMRTGLASAARAGKTSFDAIVLGMTAKYIKDRVADMPDGALLRDVVPEKEFEKILDQAEKEFARIKAIIPVMTSYPALTMKEGDHAKK